MDTAPGSFRRRREDDMELVRKEILPGVWLSCLRTEKFKTGLLSLNLLTRLSRDTAAKNALIPSVLRRGTSRYPDMEAVSARLDSLYGARLEPIVRKKGEIQCLGFWADFADDRYLPEGGGLLEEVAALMGEMLLDPNTRGGLFLQSYVESEKEKLLEQIRGRVNEKVGYSVHRMIELMCQAEDFAVDALGTEQEAENIGYVALTRHYNELLSACPVELFYCGSAEPARVEQAMLDALITLPRGELDWDIGTDIRMNALEAQPRVYTEEMDVGQGKLAIGFRLGDCMEDPDPAALRVMNAVYGGSAGSKLFLNVREKLSLCYFASSGCNIAKGIMTVISGIEADKYDAALAEIFAQLEALKQGDVTAEEFTSAKATVVSDLLAAADSAGALEEFWLSQNLMGLDYGPEEMAALAEAVTVEDIVKAAAGIECDTIYFLKGREDSHDED